MAPRPSPLADDGVDPDLVPKRALATGARIPVVGLGTFGSDSVSHDAVAEAVLEAARLGYRHFDCASVYGNEAHVGRSLRTILRSGVRREDLWVTSKLWNDKHGERDVLLSCERSLRDLQLDHLDLYLVHWPFPNYHPPGCDVTSRSPDARPYAHESYMRTWRQMERLVERGLVLHIGTSNMTVPKLDLLLRDAAIPPAANEMELHPHFQQPELLRYVVDHGVAPIGYSPIGSPGRPERDRTPDDTVDTEDPAIVAIARRLGVHPAVVCLKWGLQRGHVVIPFSVKPANLLANLRAAVTPPLTDPDMEAIAGVDRGCRLIKGQVFLWRDGQSWRDLWDEDGRIAR
ncbi:MAG TPA: aldo/keto reductase [Vicinamibacteria bacterium]|nr:aldo/keto reductase [Vicinamibacteria bacterium]